MLVRMRQLDRGNASGCDNSAEVLGGRLGVGAEPAEDLLGVLT
jgi:hypothetical protein